MKSLAILIFLSCLQPSGGVADLNCKSYKTGKFRIVSKELSIETAIERRKNIQIEKDLKTNATAKFKVTWVSDCEYELDILEGEEKMMNFFKGKTLIIRILETYKDGYKYEAQLKGTELIMTHTAERVK